MLAGYVRLKRRLLVLNNCEYPVGACAALADRLLWTGRELWILATSRELRDLGGEPTWRVPSLSVPAETVRCPQAVPTARSAAGGAS